MEVSIAHEQAAMASLPLEEVRPKAQQQQQQQQEEEEEEGKVRPQPEHSLRCPRCDSTNTKFCYYNNYSLSQPRYFCKSCRRYWTKGGTLRNVPVGGGCRKTKKSPSSSSSSKKPVLDQQTFVNTTNSNSSIPSATSVVPAPLLACDPIDLPLAFSRLQEHEINFLLGNPNHEPAAAAASFDILRSGFLDETTSVTSTGFRNLYRGYHHGNGSNVYEELVLPIPLDGGIMGGGETKTAAAGSVSTCNKAFDGGDLEDKTLMGNMGMDYIW